MQYAENQELIDSRTGSIATIVEIENNTKGTLYTVQYGDSEYRRYYDYRLEKLFIPLSNETYQPKPTIPDHKNVVFLDFANRSKFADVNSWLAWLDKII